VLEQAAESAVGIDGAIALLPGLAELFGFVVSGVRSVVTDALPLASESVDDKD
jgi:hypothetical protein